MSGPLEVVGRAVARSKGYYPTPSGHCATVWPGQSFDVVEGHPVDDWADPIEADGAEPKAEAAKAPKAPKAAAAPKASSPGRRQSSAPPPAGDIA